MMIVERTEKKERERERERKGMATLRLVPLSPFLRPELADEAMTTRQLAVGSYLSKYIPTAYYKRRRREMGFLRRQVCIQLTALEFYLGG